MRPKAPLKQPLRVFAIDDEIVFLGEGSANFSMTGRAARLTFHSLGEALNNLAVTAPDAASKPTVVVLLVEDEPLLREVGAMILKDAGYRVITADDAHQALTALEAGVEVHLMFTDIQMPGDINGLELAHMVSDRWPAVRLLISSGQIFPTPDGMPAKGRFLPKPYAVDEMLRHVEELVAA